MGFLGDSAGLGRCDLGLSGRGLGMNRESERHDDTTNDWGS